jgi:hypothetical protein
METPNAIVKTQPAQLLISLISKLNDSNSRRDHIEETRLELFKDFTTKRTNKLITGYTEPPYSDETTTQEWRFNGKWKFNRTDGNIEIMENSKHWFDEVEVREGAGASRTEKHEERTEERDVQTLNAEEFFKTQKGFGLPRGRTEIKFGDGNKVAFLEFLQQS